MTDAIRIPLSPPQQRMVAQWADQIARIVADRNLFVTALITTSYDPQQLGAWGLDIQADAIVLTPPADAPERELKLETG